MNIMMISSLNTYTKNMSMQMKWQQKKASGDYGASKTTSANQKLAEQTEGPMLPEKTDESVQELNKIRTKLNTGKSLTSSEMKFLEKHDPQMYKKAKEIEMERQAYEQELKRCKTKEEVQRLKMSKAASALSTVNEVKNNPNIPEGKKLELIVQEHLKFTTVTKATQDFVDSGHYSKLPSEVEQQKAEKDLEEAKKAEQNITDKTDDVQVQAEEDEEDTVSDSDEKKAEDVISDSKKSRAEAEVTPEARKVKWARAQAAYSKTQVSIENASSGFVDIKVG